MLAVWSQESTGLQTKCKKAEDELKKLRSAEKNIQKERENAMKAMEKAIKDSQKVVGKIRVELTKLKHARSMIAGEIESIQKDILTGADQLVAVEKTIGRLSEEVEQLRAQVSEMRD